jgi:hypothetical protein
MDWYRAAFGLPDVDASRREAIFPLRAQVIEKVSGAADETRQRA